jgi:hypothetical protein
MSKKIVYMLMIMIGCVSISFAQSENDIRNPISIGAQIGWQKAADADNGMVMFGGLLRAKLTYAVSFEASINYRQEKYHNGDIKVSNWPVQLSGLFFPIQHIYGLAGVGWYNAKLEFSGRLNGLPDKTSQKFGWHFGAGMEIPLGERTFIFGDFRYIFLNYDFTDVPGGGEISSDYFQINAGLMFPL